MFESASALYPKAGHRRALCSAIVILIEATHVKLNRSVPGPDEVLWSGSACGTQWEVRFVGVCEADDEEDGVASPDGTKKDWELSFDSATGESFRRTWSRHDRILFGTLAGWSKTSIGNLKRTLLLR